jgi:hypothetical protein
MRDTFQDRPEIAQQVNQLRKQGFSGLVIGDKVGLNVPTATSGYFQYD